MPTIKRVLKEVGELDSKKIIENSLRESEESYRILFENNLAGVFNATIEGKILKCNQACAEIFGYDSIDEFLLVPLQDHYNRGNDTKDLISLVLEKKTIKNYELNLRKRNGDSICVLSNIGLIHDPFTWEIGVQGTIFDITERKIALEKIIQAKEKAEEADKIKSEFLAQVSHEIRTPLNVILSYHLLLKDEINESFREENSYIFNAIQLAGRRLVRTIDLILNMSVIQSGKMELILKKINIYNLLKSLYDEFQTFADAKDLDFNLINNVAEPIVVSDSYIIGQVIQNLIENAIKFTEHGEALLSSIEI